jgi:membrane protein YqaA with SNARE-associated domain
VTFLAIAAGAAVGSFLGNTAVFWVIGRMAERNQKKQEAELKELEKGYLEMLQRERNRMENYAKMEG